MDKPPKPRKPRRVPPRQPVPRHAPVPWIAWHCRLGLWQTVVGETRATRQTLCTARHHADAVVALNVWLSTRGGLCGPTFTLARTRRNLPVVLDATPVAAEPSAAPSQPSRRVRPGHGRATVPTPTPDTLDSPPSPLLSGLLSILEGEER